jgi:hypothetical protein
MNRDRGENDLQPTMPGARVEPLAPARGSRTTTKLKLNQRVLPELADYKSKQSKSF